ncbi:hypothetical protein CIB95_13810 [Lottiidibacillus patelloidae]|uniref:PPM-type phosphatase domain-containing protein n=1 Tax=Lottiidibacillus patelloidae TaxID=2670334 RepID=A0A263BR37_9BACI|nr:protein phosphatase 2C domain-containing protein [Lottiidibacillus patelloidae]OZM56173.1 hypothetical protein CIB95_13810 [Lottiidibacillus patelloidae]
MKFDTFALTMTGGRMVNEDACGSFEEGSRYLWVVADGLGGHRGGEIAAKRSVELMIEKFKGNFEVSEEAIQTCFAYANTQIRKEQQENITLNQMKATAVALCTNIEKTVISHIGDTRCYYFKQGKIVSQTIDHSVVQVLANNREIAKEEIRFHEDRNKVLRSIGKEDICRPTTISLESRLENGDAFLLCSDGFWEYVYEEEMEVDFLKADTPEKWLEMMEGRLLKRATGNYDNYTAIAIFCKE